MAGQAEAPGGAGDFDGAGGAGVVGAPGSLGVQGPGGTVGADADGGAVGADADGGAVGADADGGTVGADADGGTVGADADGAAGEAAQSELYRQLADAVPGLSVMVVDGDLCIALAAGGGFAAVGLDPTSLVGEPVTTVIGEERLAAARVRYLQALAGVASAEERVVLRGRTFSVRYLPIGGATGQRQVLVVSQDESASEATARALRRSEAAYAAVFEQSLVGNAMVALSGRFIRVNEAFGRMVGYRPDELIGLSWASVTHPDDVVANASAVNGLLAGADSSVILDKRFVHVSGRVVDAIVGVTLVRDEGSPHHYHSQIVDVSELRAAQARLRREAATDPLTGLPNRRATDAALRAYCEERRGRRPAGGIILLDLDRFKAVNDTYGHGAGDDALCAVADQWRARLRRGDVLGRVGGDELLVLLPAATPGEAQEVARALVAPVHTSSGEGKVTACAGVALLRPGDDAESLVERADRALLVAKRVGPGNVAVDTLS